MIKLSIKHKLYSFVKASTIDANATCSQINEVEQKWREIVESGWNNGFDPYIISSKVIDSIEGIVNANRDKKQNVTTLACIFAAAFSKSELGACEIYNDILFLFFMNGYYSSYAHEELESAAEIAVRNRFPNFHAGRD